MDTRTLEQVVSDIASQPPICTPGMIALASSLEIRLRNFYLYNTGLKNNADYDAGYCEGKRDAFLQILRFLDGSVNIADRIDELNEILVGVE